MKTISRAQLDRRLSTANCAIDKPFHPPARHTHHLIVSPDVSNEEIGQVFRAFGEAVDAKPPLIVFPDGYSGWRHANRLQKRRAILINDVEEAFTVVLAHSHFRRRHFDNYFTFDSGAAWFVLFCHDDDVHFWMVPDICASPAVRAWQRRFEAHLYQKPLHSNDVQPLV